MWAAGSAVTDDERKYGRSTRALLHSTWMSTVGFEGAQVSVPTAHHRGEDESLLCGSKWCVFGSDVKLLYRWRSWLGVPNIRYYSVSSISALLSIMICVTFTTLHMVDNGEFRHFNQNSPLSIW